MNVRYACVLNQSVALAALRGRCCAGGDADGMHMRHERDVMELSIAACVHARLSQAMLIVQPRLAQAAMAVVFDLVPELVASDLVLVPMIDLTEEDEDVQAAKSVRLPAVDVEPGPAPEPEGPAARAPGARRSRRVRAPPRRASGLPPPRLVDADGHATTAFERIESDTRWGRCFSCRRALRPSVSRSGQALLSCSKKEPPNWHTCIPLTAQQADALDFPRVVYSKVRAIW